MGALNPENLPFLGVDDPLLLLNYHWARDTSTFPTEQHRVGFALILLLLFSTECWPAELVDGRKEKRDDADFEEDELEVVNNDDILAADKSDTGFRNENNDINSRNDGALSGVSDEAVRQFDAIYYEDVRLLIVRSSEGGERDVLAMEITMDHHKGYKRRLKP